jgi:hypothetical protein
MRGRHVALIAAAALVLGCGQSGANVPLLTGVPPISRGNDGSIGCFTSSASGPLVADPKYGVAIRDTDTGGDLSPVAWRPGFTGRQVGSEVEVLDPDGKVVAMTGKSYRIRGGYVGDDAIWPVAVFWACDLVTPQP